MDRSWILLIRQCAGHRKGTGMGVGSQWKGEQTELNEEPAYVANPDFKL